MLRLLAEDAHQVLGIVARQPFLLCAGGQSVVAKSRVVAQKIDQDVGAVAFEVAVAWWLHEYLDNFGRSGHADGLTIAAPAPSILV